MEVMFVWLLGSFLVAYVIGRTRTIGFWVSLLSSLLLSPVAGLIISLSFKTKDEDRRQKQMRELQEQQMAAKKKKPNVQIRLRENLAALDELKKSGTITDEEWQFERNKFIREFGGV
jgi:membrane protein implicated in regulation of membrane protease activity